MRIEHKVCKKTSDFYVSVICTTTGETGQTRACVSRYDQSAWRAKIDETWNVAQVQLCDCISKHPGYHIKKRNGKLLMHQKVN